MDHRRIREVQRRGSAELLADGKRAAFLLLIDAPVYTTALTAILEYTENTTELFKMTPTPETLIWPGAESLAKVQRALQERRAVELVLSAGLHYAFYSRFEAEAPEKSEIEVDVQGGAELIGQIKDIAGLEPLAELQRTLQADGWSVTITSPTPRIILSPRS